MLYMLPGVSRMSPYGCFWSAATNPMDVTAAIKHTWLQNYSGCSCEIWRTFCLALTLTSMQLHACMQRRSRSCLEGPGHMQDEAGSQFLRGALLEWESLPQIW